MFCINAMLPSQKVVYNEVTIEDRAFRLHLGVMEQGKLEYLQ